MKFWIIMNKIYTLIFCLVLSNNISFGQIGTSSPYSRYGIGDFQFIASSQYNALSGAITAFSDPTYINPHNPSTYIDYGPNSFLFTTGLRHRIIKMQNLTEEQLTHNTTFSHLNLGFPITKRIGASVGLLPFSDIGYEFENTNSINNSTSIYYGDGGLSKIYFGGAYKVNSNFSIGINASYVFGGLNRRKKIIFNDNSFLNSRSNSQINLQGYYYEIGLLYKRDLSDNKKVSFGLVSTNSAEIRAKKNEIVESFVNTGVLETPKDTAINTTDWGFLNLPQNIRIGFSYQEGNKILFLTDYNLFNWSNYKLFNENDNLINSSNFSLGVQYTPKYNSVTQYYKRIEYRIGCSFGNLPLEFENTTLPDKSISLGFGLPYKKSRTKYDLSLILGERGTTDNNLIKEQYVKLGLTISYDGIWFVKRKYD